jgi:hypothetical protein
MNFLKGLTSHPNKKPGLIKPGLSNTNYLVIFGGLAVVVTCSVTVDPWLCVAGFRRFCLYRMSLYESTYSTKLKSSTLQESVNAILKLQSQ